MDDRAPRHWPGSGDLVDVSSPRDAAQRANQVATYLDGALAPDTVQAMRNVWSLLETSATSNPAHARAVRERMLWDSIDSAA